MITELGHFCVILAFIVAIIAVIFKDMSIRGLGVATLLLITAQGSLAYGFYVKDLSIAIVALNPSYTEHISALILLGITIIAVVLSAVKSKINVNLIRIFSIIVASSIGILLIEYNPFLRASIKMVESI